MNIELYSFSPFTVPRSAAVSAVSVVMYGLYHPSVPPEGEYLGAVIRVNNHNYSLFTNWSSSWQEKVFAFEYNPYTDDVWYPDEVNDSNYLQAFGAGWTGNTGERYVGRIYIKVDWEPAKYAQCQII
jgi:hypothetical protein